MGELLEEPVKRYPALSIERALIRAVEDGLIESVRIVRREPRNNTN